MMATAAHALHGMTVLVTRATEQAKSFVDRLRAHGAQVIEAPMVAIVPPASWQEADAAIADLSRFDWIVFASANAVRCFLDRMNELQVPIENLESMRIAVVGKVTAEAVLETGLRVDLVPPQHNAAGLADEFKGLDVAGKHILVPRPQQGRDELLHRLTDLGAEVTSVAVYRTVAPWHLDGQPTGPPKIDLQRVDLVTFFSPSAVRHFLEVVSIAELRARHRTGMRIAVIGPTTRATATAAGLPVDIMPEEATSEALVRELLDEVAHHPEPQSAHVSGAEAQR